MDNVDKFNESSAVEGSRMVPGIGRIPYPAYRGNGSYIFVSYAHADAAVTFAQIKRFNEAGFNVWYDEGIAPGNSWSNDIATALEICSVFVVMITPKSVSRPNVLDEIEFALDEDKNFIAIYLEDTELPPGLKLRIRRKQAILKYSMSEDEYVYKFIEAFTRFGLERHSPAEPVPQAAPAVHSAAVAASVKKEEIYDDAPADAAKRANGDIVRINGFDIEHGFLRGYYGSDKDLVLPDNAGVIGSTSFKQCSSFIESVDLNKAGSILGGAFFNCPNLHTVKVPESVSTIKPDAFRYCPNLTLYVRKSQLPEGFAEKFDGRKIVYLDVDAPVPAPAVTSVPVSSEPRHEWGDYEPKGTAYIKTTDGAEQKAIANSLMFRTCGHLLLEGIGRHDELRVSKRESVVPFADMVSVAGIAGGLKIEDVCGDEYDISIPPEDELWFIGGNGKEISSVRVGEIESVTFDRKVTPDTGIRYCEVKLKQGSFRTPFACLWVSVNENPGLPPRMVLHQDMNKYARCDMQLKRISRLVITKPAEPNDMYKPPNPMEVRAELRNGDELDFTVEGRSTIYAMSARGIVRRLGYTVLEEIVFS